MQTVSYTKAMLIFMLMLSYTTMFLSKADNNNNRNRPQNLQSPQQPLGGRPPVNRVQASALYSSPALYSPPAVRTVRPPPSPPKTFPSARPTMYQKPNMIQPCSPPKPKVTMYVAPPQRRPPQKNVYAAPVKPTAYKAPPAPKQQYYAKPASTAANNGGGKKVAAAPKSPGAGQTTAQGTTDNKNSWFGDSSSATSTLPSVITFAVLAVVAANI